MKRLRSVILVAHSPRTKNTRTCAASLFRCCDRAEEPEHHPLVRIFNGSGITRAPRKNLFHVTNGVLKTPYNSDPTAKSKLGEYATSTPPAVTLRIRNSPPRKLALGVAQQHVGHAAARESQRHRRHTACRRPLCKGTSSYSYSSCVSSCVQALS